jgi:hypothetical protein
VEHDSVQVDTDSRELRFNLKKDQAFQEEKVREALKKEGFKEMTVKQAPSP